MRNLLLQNKKNTYISSINDIENVSGKDASKDKLILVGDAVLAVFKSKQSQIDLETGMLNNYVPQRPRSVAGLLSGFVTKESAFLELFVEKEIASKLQGRGVKERSVYLAADSILRFIKFSAIKRHGLVLCVSPIKNNHGSTLCHLVEEYRFSAGELIGFTERRYDTSIIGLELNKAVKESLRSFSAELLTEVIVCGPDTNRVIDALPDYHCVDAHSKIFGQPVKSSFTYDTVRKERVLPYLAALSISIAVAMVMALSGKGQLDRAQKGYSESVAGFETIYSKGRAPIELVERRSSYMAQLEADKRASYKLPALVSAIAKIKSASPELNVVAEEVTYFSSSDKAQQRPEDFKVVLRFNKLPAMSPEAELQQWQGVFLSFSKEMRGLARVNDSPITLRVGNDAEVFIMTIVGNFETQI